MKKLVIAAMTAALLMSATTVMAVKVRCIVDSVEGNKVTMTCKKADKLKAGQQIEIKEKKLYEGC